MEAQKLTYRKWPSVFGSASIFDSVFASSSTSYMKLKKGYVLSNSLIMYVGSKDWGTRREETWRSMVEKMLVGWGLHFQFQKKSCVAEAKFLIDEYS